MLLIFERCLSLALFNAAKHNARRPWNLAVITPEEFAKADAWVSVDPARGWGRTGFVITHDGELVNLYNLGAPGDGRLAAQRAIELGAYHLNCFDGFLVRYYEKLGFRETSRACFDDSLAPAGWDYAALGRPDVVFMALPQTGQQQTEQEVADALA